MPTENKNIIHVKNLVKKFKDFTAVDSISFEVKEGEIFAFLGPNGAGKSTTIRMLTTLLKPESGEIMINGHDPVKQKHAARESFGIVFQDASLDSDLTALENMQLHAVLFKMPREQRSKKIEELLKFVDLWDRKGDFVKNFSGGMRRRLEIARGLLHKPKILFLDEPTLGLDPQTRNHMWNYIKEINEKDRMTIFFTTHYMEEAEKIAQRIAIIDHGKIVASGTVEDLREKTKTGSLEEAFLSLTGNTIREEEATSVDHLRAMSKMWTKRGDDMQIIYILWLRQIKKYFRSKSRIIGSLGQPVLFLVAFGFGFGAIYKKAEGGNYIQFLAPGIIMMSVLFTAMFSGIELIWDKQFGFLKETMAAPVYRIQIMLGRTLGGATVATIQGVIVLLLTLLVGFKIDNLYMLPLSILFIFIVALLFTSMGTAIASVLEDMQGFQMIMNFLVMPTFFLSGALFPLHGIPMFLEVIAKFDPLTYGIDGFRQALISQAHFGMGIDITVLSVVTIIILFTGSYLFERIEA